MASTNPFFSSEISEANVCIEGPPSPVIGANKINRRLILNRKKQKSRAKLTQQFVQENLILNSNETGILPQSRMKEIVTAENERRKYYELLCNENSSVMPNDTPSCQFTIKNSHIQENQCSTGNMRRIADMSENQKQICIQTASGKNIEIPEHVLNEYKYIFDDIINDQNSNPSVLKCPVKSKVTKTSKIPVLNRISNVTHPSTAGSSFFGSLVEETNSQLKVVKEAVANEGVGKSLHVLHKQVENISPSVDNFEITESFINAAETMLEVDKTIILDNFEFEELKGKANDMNELYSNRNYKDSNNSAASLTSCNCKDLIGRANVVSEVSVESSVFCTCMMKAHIPQNSKISNNVTVITDSHFGDVICDELSVMDVVTDDWSDTLQIQRMHGITENFFTEIEKMNIKCDNKNQISKIVEITESNISNDNGNKGSNDNIFDSLNNENQFTRSKEIEISKFGENLQAKNNCRDKNSKNLTFSATHKTICGVHNMNSDKLVELHRNKNFIGNSDSSFSNPDYKLSQHSVHVKKRILKAEKKLLHGDFIGFEKNTQELANKKAFIIVNNIKQIEKQIMDKELLIHTRSKSDKKSKDKKSKKSKCECSEIDYHKTCNNSASSKDKEKKKDKTKVVKSKVPCNSLQENICQEIRKEEINKTVTYDHVSIVSEQSCKKYKDYKKRKSVTVDKDLSEHRNQTIELFPNQKKFKIEIDCNNKFKINISCNCSQPDKDIHKSDCTAIDNTEKSLFKNVSDNEKTLNEAKKKFGAIESEASNKDASNKTDLLQDHKDEFCNSMDTGKGKIIKTYLSKAHKLYRDMRNPDVQQNPDKKLEKMKEIDCDMKFIQKINDQSFMLGNFYGFKSVSGKNINFSERSLKAAQKMYETTEDTLIKGNQEINMDVDKKIDDNIKAKETNFSKRRPRILYTDIKDVDTNMKILIPNQKKNRENLIKNDNPQKKIDNSSVGFQSASGRNINISANAMKKAEQLFDEHNFSSGDSVNPTNMMSGFASASGKKIEISDKYMQEAKLLYENCNTADLCMGDFKKKNTDVTLVSDTKQIVNGTSSKKTFEILQDLAETVDCALETIQKNNNKTSKKRLGISRCKQIDVPKENIDRAKKLFSNDNFDDSVKDSIIANSSFKTEPIGYNSTPLRKDVCFSRSKIESEITPIKCEEDIKDVKEIEFNDITLQDSRIMLHEKTTGTLDDWYGTIFKQIDSYKEILKNLENKKSNLEKQMGLLHYSSKEHRRQRSGSLYSKKITNTKRAHLKSLECNNANSCDKTCDIWNNITPKNANMLHFNCTSSENITQTEDGAIVIANAKNLIGLPEIEMAFQTMQGVEPGLIPKGWIANHYRLIVWKLTSYERFSPEQLKGSLSIDNVIQQIKYRYDREIDRAQRPAIRKILEKDDIPQKRMVLCVSDIINAPNNSIELELTDGWYCLRTIIDRPLIAQVKQKKIKIGTKLIINGAQILNCDGCPPLEVSDFVKLKISYNCTRRAIWYAKLGYQKCPEPFPVPLSSIHPDGGIIGCLKVNVIRVYPIRYMEQTDDRKVWRNGKAEQKYSNAFENERLEKIERIHYNIKEKFERDLCLGNKKKLTESSKLNKTEILKLTCPQTLYDLFESSNDPDSLMELLSPTQRVSVLEYRQRICLQRQQEMSNKISSEIDKLKLARRKVIPILKLLIIDTYTKSESPHQFCIWNPKEEDMSILKEDSSFTVYNIAPRSNGDLFSTTKTHFVIDKNSSMSPKYKRQIFPIAMTLDTCYQPFFNEFDTIGLVVQVIINEYDQKLWISDAQGRLLSVKIKDGPKMCSLLDGLMAGQVVSLLNLVYCKPQKEFGQAIANQFSVISNFSQQNFLQEYIHQFKMQLPKDVFKLIKECESNIEKYIIKCDIRYSSYTSTSVDQSSPKSFNNSTLDVSDDDTLLSSKLTATDVAMSLIDTDKFT